ncbi:MAG: NfeD family protein [Verrucomicrobiales bacterium]
MLTTVIILAIFGIAMIAVEVILPGGIFGAIGALTIGASLFLTATSADLNHIGTDGRFLLGGGIMITSVVLLGLWLKFFTRARFVKRHLLEDEVGGTTNYDKYQALLDQSGVAETDLRPAGKGRLDGIKYDVLAETGMISNGSKIKVVRVEGSRVIVRAGES